MKNKPGFILAVLICVFLFSGFVLVNEDPSAEIELNETNFPDENFREVVRQYYDKDENGFLSPEEISEVDEVNCESRNISTVKGIEYLTSLRSFCCNGNCLTELDLSRNANLEILVCRYNQKPWKLNLSGSTKLNYLDCRFSQVESMDLSGAAQLEYLCCYSNGLTSLDLSKNRALDLLYCDNNNLTELDLSRNTSLELLVCNNNKLKELDLSRNTMLQKIDCSGNQLDGLDLSHNTALVTLKCISNRLTDLDLGENTAINEVKCYDNHLAVLDISRNSNILRAVKEGVWEYVEDTQGIPFLYHAFNLYYIDTDPDTVLITDGNPFSDVKEGKFYYKPVMWAYYHEPKITGGTDPTHFKPNDPCTRAQVVTFLWRAKGCPEPAITETRFTDVNPEKFYYKAMLWAVENNITTGTDDTHFKPNDPCTRAQVVTFLWRAEGSPAPESTVISFTDVNPGKFYYLPMLWAVNNNITTGTSPTTFEPNTTCTRSQVVTFLFRDMTGTANSKAADQG